MANEDLKQAESRTEGQTVDPVINQEPETTIPRTEGKEQKEGSERDNTGEKHPKRELEKKREDGQNV